MSRQKASPQFVTGTFNLYLVLAPHPISGRPSLRVWARRAGESDSLDTLMPTDPYAEKQYAFLCQCYADTQAALNAAVSVFQRDWRQDFDYSSVPVNRPPVQMVWAISNE